MDIDFDFSSKKKLNIKVYRVEMKNETKEIYLNEEDNIYEIVLVYSKAHFE